MPSVIQCPKCKSQLQVDDGAWTEYFQCPACRTTFRAAAKSGARSAPGPQRAPWEEEPAWKNLPPPKAFAVHEEFETSRPELRGTPLPHRGPLVLALGFSGLCLSCLVPAGWVLGGMAIAMGGDDLSRMTRGTMDPSGRALTAAGRICGIVAIVLATLALLWFIFLFFIRVGS